MSLIAERFNNPSLWSLITANLLVAALALRFDWSLIELLWIYWCQSVIIGVINFIKLLTLADFSTEGFTVNGRSVPANQLTKFSTALFFALHYGTFHLVYLIFLSVFTLAGNELPLGPGVTSVAGIVFSTLVFLANHLFSFYSNWPQERLGTNIGQQMFIPYVRIIPMHLTIIFGAVLGSATGGTFVPLLLFLALKTFADVALHLYEHRPVV
ncbi:MAG: DUF6498-containing protein [Candidatus Margulisbacteria bacterium]|nr:DUF6498-containing protein [Candidatus Margulisiibacteriota bacterium]